MVDVLIADRGDKIGDAVANSLRDHGLSVEVFDDAAVANDEPGYVRNIRRKVEECRPRMVMPIFKAEWLARHREEIGAAIPVCEAETIALLDDKVACSALCGRLGIQQPHMYMDSEIGEISRWPVVYKRAAGLSGSSVYFPKDAKALGNLIKSSTKPHLVMDYIDGYDVSVDAIRWPLEGGGTYVQAAAYRVLLPKKKGISYLRIGSSRKDIIDVALLILEATNFKGVCGFDFRIDRKTGKAYFLECNPRFSGGIRSSLAAGLDLPWLLWQLECGEIPESVKLKKHRISYDR